MFDDLPDPSTCGELTLEAMVSAIGAFHRAEATMVARNWAFIARLLAHHKDNAAEEEKTWAYDEWAAVRDQVGPAMRLSPRRASGQMRLAEGLASRLPRVAALLDAGSINTRVAETIVYRTELLTPAVHNAVDAEIAEQAGGFTTLSEEALELALDAIIEEHDPDACRRYQEAAKNCEVAFGKRDDATGTSSVYGRISAADAELGTRVLNALAATVCPNDPRSRGELRAAAQGAVYRRQDRLICQCADPTCQAATLPSTVPSAVIHVLADKAALDAALAQIDGLRQAQSAGSAAPPAVDFEAVLRQADAAEAAHTATPPDEPPWAHRTPIPPDPDDDDDPQGGTGSSPQPPPGPSDPEAKVEAETQQENPKKTVQQPDSPHETPQAPAACTPHRRPKPAVTLGGAIIPLGLLAELLRTGAAVKALPIPGAQPATGYRFTGSVREFIQCRDMRCRFPGCNRKAEHADIDHTIPYGVDGGATHPSNGKALCREHHLAKTFRGGPTGWHDEQLPNGDVHWTAPTGHRYLTQPVVKLLFPDWDPTTASLPPPMRERRRNTDPEITMPIRKKTREEDREQRIKTEREYNASQRALEQSGQLRQSRRRS